MPPTIETGPNAFAPPPQAGPSGPMYSYGPCTADHETEKAIRVLFQYGLVEWIPKTQIASFSQVKAKGDHGNLVITQWLAKQKDLDAKLLKAAWAAVQGLGQAPPNPNGVQQQQQGIWPTGPTGPGPGQPIKYPKPQPPRQEPPPQKPLQPSVTGLTEAYRVYRRLARKYHPDTNREPWAANVMADLTELWQAVLAARKR